MDEIAKIYIKRLDCIYRIKIFENTIGVERQRPDREMSVLLPRVGWNRRLYDEDTLSWDMDEFDSIIAQYEMQIMQLDKG